MRSLIIGESPLLDALRTRLKSIPASVYTVPGGVQVEEQARFLVEHPVPSGQRGVVFTNSAANWLPVSKAGWEILWCGENNPPYGTTGVLERHEAWTVGDIAKEYWGVHVVDRRLVSDVLAGKVSAVGVLLPVTSNTGGVGKTTSCRRLAERATQMGVRTLLVDGNMAQSSQRSFFDPGMRLEVPTIATWRGGMRPQVAATAGKHLGVGYDVVFAPPAGVTVTWEIYRRYVRQARRLWQLVIIDLDRINADDLYTHGTAAGDLLIPNAMAGDPFLLIVRAGRQTQADAANLLGALRAEEIPRELVGIKDTVPIGLKDYRQFDYEEYGTFLGVEHMSVEAANHLNNGETGWADPCADMARERVLSWLMPEVGFDPTKYEAKQRKEKRSWFHRR